MAQSFTTLLNNPENLQLVLKKLPAVISLVMVIACAHILSQITWSLFSDPEQAMSTTTRTPKITPKADNLQSFRQLTSAHLFGIAGQTKTTKATKAPETKLNLVLRGVLAADPMTTASAIIARGKSGKEEIFGIGDKLPGGVAIKEIHPEHVILERKGQLETLRLLKDNEVVKFSRSSGSPSPRGSKAGTPGSALKNIRSNIMKNPTSFTEYALPIIVKENGKQIGYRLQPQKQGELLSQMGLEPSDVIISVNGLALSDPKNGVGALRNLSTATEVNIIVKRNGTEVPLSIQLQ